MAHYEDFSIDQGTDVSIGLHLLNKDKSIKNLTDYSVNAYLKPNYASGDSDRTVFTGIIADPATDGIVNLSLTNTQTDALNPKKRYVYDVELSYVSDSDGLGNLTYIIERILEGYVTVTPSVTR